MEPQPRDPDVDRMLAFCAGDAGAFDQLFERWAGPLLRYLERMVGDEATVKRLRIRRKRVELHAENPDFEPIVPDPRELTLLGKVVEVHRRLD